MGGKLQDVFKIDKRRMELHSDGTIDKFEKERSDRPSEVLDNIKQLCVQVLVERFPWLKDLEGLRKSERRSPIFWAQPEIQSSSATIIRYAAQLLKQCDELTEIRQTQDSGILDRAWAECCVGYGALMLLLNEVPIAKAFKQKLDGAEAGKRNGIEKGKKPGRTAEYQPEIDAILSKNPQISLTDARAQVAMQNGVTVDAIKKYTVDPRKPKKSRTTLRIPK